MCNATAQEPCKLTAMGTAHVAAVRDGRTLLLDDGRELRLAAIEVPDDTRAPLQALVAGHATGSTATVMGSAGAARHDKKVQ